MALLKPIVTYALTSILVLWVVLGAITLPNANRWLRGTGYSIKEEVILVNEETAINYSTAKRYGDRYFQSSVYHIDNTPNVPNQGLQGVLYDLGEACMTDPNVIPVPNFINHNNISKIALIQQTQNCFLADKLNFAQLDGASGGIMPGIVTVPAYYIDASSGLILLKDLENVFKINSDNARNETVIRVTLSPAMKPAKSDTNGYVAVLQCHMWRIAQNSASSMTTNENEILTADEQRQLAMDDDFWRGIIGQPPQPLLVRTKRKRQSLDQALVNLLPTRMYKSREQRKEMYSEKKETSSNVSVDSFGTLCELSSCVICLDNFEPGNILRRLPCNHEYHRDYIWLTKKCASCPLCQQIIQIPTVPDEIHVRTEEESQMYADMPGLAETWSGMVREQQVAVRQSPWAALQNTYPYNS
ncbi:hypothetical protein HPULCUR_006907 [Helicostylum pulchrum]|uniref:RING-type domain-containing protein n=1 Tax=Helicostylum pulchrum TaxID=562976 RepID=A0ABP9Y3D5_9FUNG